VSNLTRHFPRTWMMNEWSLVFPVSLSKNRITTHIDIETLQIPLLLLFNASNPLSLSLWSDFNQMRFGSDHRWSNLIIGGRGLWSSVSFLSPSSLPSFSFLAGFNFSLAMVKLLTLCIFLILSFRFSYFHSFSIQFHPFQVVASFLMIYLVL
jgi:hypothetical protein